MGLKMKTISSETRAVLALRIGDAAHSIGISKSKLYQLISAGEVHKTTIGGRSVVLAEELERYVRHCSEESERKAAQSSISSRRFSKASPLR
jgi:predicted DNA-binding transcriptional regulator AlpA